MLRVCYQSILQLLNQTAEGNLPEAGSAGRKSSLEAETSTNPATTIIDAPQSQTAIQGANADITIDDMSRFVGAFSKDVMSS